MRIDELRKYKIAIAAIQETRWTKSTPRAFVSSKFNIYTTTTRICKQQSEKWQRTPSAAHENRREMSGSTMSEKRLEGKNALRGTQDRGTCLEGNKAIRKGGFNRSSAFSNHTGIRQILQATKLREKVVRSTNDPVSGQERRTANNKRSSDIKHLTFK
jgi:hypothetical protein